MLIAGRILQDSLAEGGPLQGGYPGQKLRMIPKVLKAMAAQACPQMAQGVSADVSTINPWTSGGGGSYGFNLQYLPGRGLALYGFSTPNNTSSVGFDVGGSITVNGAVGSGPWRGDFMTAMGSYLAATFGGFGSPSEQPGIGWHGLQGGVTFGAPAGVGATTTTYHKVVDLSFLVPWCQ